MADPRYFLPRAKSTYRQHRPLDTATVYHTERSDGAPATWADRAELERCRRCNPPPAPITDERRAPGAS